MDKGRNVGGGGGGEERLKEQGGPKFSRAIANGYTVTILQCVRQNRASEFLRDLQFRSCFMVRGFYLNPRDVTV